MFGMGTGVPPKRIATRIPSDSFDSNPGSFVIKVSLDNSITDNGPYFFFLRKEVIQPHLPIRLPCYDFTPVIGPAFDGSLLERLGHRLRALLTPMV